MNMKQKFEHWYYYMQGVSYGRMNLSNEITPEEAEKHIVLLLEQYGAKKKDSSPELHVFPVESPWGLLLPERGRQEKLEEINF